MRRQRDCEKGTETTEKVRKGRERERERERKGREGKREERKTNRDRNAEKDPSPWRRGAGGHRLRRGL